MKYYLAIPALLAATVASAADKPFSQVDGLRALNSLGRCIADDPLRSGADAVTLPFGSPEQGKAAVAFLEDGNSCFSQDVEFDFEPNLLIGGIAEQLFLKRYGDQDPTSLVAASTVGARNEVEDLGLCVVMRNPSNVRALIESEPASPTEAAAVEKMMPDLAPCVPAGMEVKLSKPRLRALFAASLYRIASGR